MACEWEGANSLTNSRRTSILPETEYYETDPKLCIQVHKPQVFPMWVSNHVLCNHSWSSVFYDDFFISGLAKERAVFMQTQKYNLVQRNDDFWYSSSRSARNAGIIFFLPQRNNSLVGSSSGYRHFFILLTQPAIQRVKKWSKLNYTVFSYFLEAPWDSILNCPFWFISLAMIYLPNRRESSSSKCKNS